MTFAILLFALTLLAYLVPSYDWDLLAYVGAGIALHEQDARAIHSQAYAALRASLPEEDYRDIAQGSAFRRDISRNPNHFIEQLRFYNIRPVYIRALALLHGAGIGWVQATRIISATSFCLLGLLLFWWALQLDVGAWPAAICIPLLMLAPVLFTSARTGSPDALAALIVVAGVYFLLVGQHEILGGALLLLSLLARTDNVIFAFLLLGWLSLRATSRPRRSVYAAFALASVVAVLAVNHIEHSYPWQVLMLNTANPISNPAETAVKFTASDYFAAWRDIVEEAIDSSFLVFPFIAALILFYGELKKEWKDLLCLVLISWMLHLVVFPHVEDRYFVAGSALIGLAGLVALSQIGNHSLTESQADL